MISSNKSQNQANFITVAASTSSNKRPSSSNSNVIRKNPYAHRNFVIPNNGSLTTIFMQQTNSPTANKAVTSKIHFNDNRLVIPSNKAPGYTKTKK